MPNCLVIVLDQVRRDKSTPGCTPPRPHLFKSKVGRVFGRSPATRGRALRCNSSLAPLAAGIPLRSLTRGPISPTGSNPRSRPGFRRAIPRVVSCQRLDLGARADRRRGRSPGHPHSSSRPTTRQRRPGRKRPGRFFATPWATSQGSFSASCRRSSRMLRRPRSRIPWVGWRCARPSDSSHARSE